VRRVRQGSCRAMSEERPYECCQRNRSSVSLGAHLIEQSIKTPLLLDCCQLRRRVLSDQCEPVSVNPIPAFDQAVRRPCHAGIAASRTHVRKGRQAELGCPPTTVLFQVHTMSDARLTGCPVFADCVAASAIARAATPSSSVTGRVALVATAVTKAAHSAA
jgi:hypothetical protein